MATNNATNTSNPVTVAQGGTGASSFTAYSVLCGGTSTTNPIQIVSGLGSSGQVLTSNNASALPTFQSSSALVNSAQFVLTSAQVKTLSGTPYTIVPAAGSNTVILITSVVEKLTYGGTNAFTGGSGLTLYYTNNAGPTAGINATLTMTATSNQYGFQSGTNLGGTTIISSYTNKDVVLSVSGANFGGNAAGNNTLSIYVTYVILTV